MLTRKELTIAVRRFAKEYGYSASTVRAVTALKNRAIEKFKYDAIVASLPPIELELASEETKAKFIPKGWRYV